MSIASFSSTSSSEGEFVIKSYVSLKSLSALSQNASLSPESSAEEFSLKKFKPKKKKATSTAYIENDGLSIIKQAVDLFSECIDCKENAVAQWMSELRWHSELECPNLLLVKSIAMPTTFRQVNYALPYKGYIDAVEKRSSIITTDFNKVFQNMQKARLRQLPCHVRHLTSDIRSLLQYISDRVKLHSADFHSTEANVRQLALKLETAVSEFLVLNGHIPSLEPTSRHISSLLTKFNDLIGITHTELLDRIVQSICDSDPRTPINILSSALQDLTCLCCESPKFIDILLKVKGVERIVALFRDERCQPVWSQALRTLTASCSVPESVRHMETCGGVLSVVSLLSDLSLSEMIRGGAAGVIAQLTNPVVLHLVGESLPTITNNFDRLIRALTMLSIESSCPDIFLRTATAIANITYLNPSSFEFILRHNTIRALIDACQLNKAKTFLSKDQVATVLANMAVYKSCHRTLASLNSIELLLQFLSESALQFYKVSNILLPTMEAAIRYSSHNKRHSTLDHLGSPQRRFSSRVEPSLVSIQPNTKQLTSSSNSSINSQVYLDRRHSFHEFDNLSSLLNREYDPLSLSEKYACIRLHQKSAIALARLSKEPINAQIIIECDGLVRLSQLCRCPDERSGSDAVLVASLAAMREIYQSVGSEDFSTEDLEDFIHPKMIDSFLNCSHMNENFV